MVAIVPPAGWDAGLSTGRNPDPQREANLPAAKEPVLAISTSAITIVPSDFLVDLPLEPAPVTTPAEEPTTVDAEMAPGGVSSVAWWLAGGAAAVLVASVTFVLWPNAPEPIAVPAATIVAKPVAPAVTESTESKQDANPGVAAMSGSTDAAAATTAAADQKSAPVTEKKSTPSVVPPTVAVPPVAQGSSPASSASVAQAPAAKPAPSPTLESPSPVTASAAKPAASMERPDAPSTVASAGGSSHVLRFDPLDFDPEHLSLSTSPKAAESDAQSMAVAGSIAADAAPAPAAAAIEKAADPLPMMNQAIQVRRGPAIPPATQPLDTAQRLATTVRSLQLSDAPLAKFVGTMSELAGTPITLNPRVLALNGQSARTTVSVNIADLPIDQVLRDVLAEKRLELDESRGQLSVTLAGAAEQLSVDFDVKDLFREGDASPIAKLIEQFVVPRSWKAGGGKGTIKVDGGVLHIDQTLSVRREALIFCERLRLARGRSLRSKYPAELLTLESPYFKLAPKLQQPTTFTYLPWMRLADFARELQELAGFTILVDWAALADVNLEPSSPLACSVNNRPWGEALDGVLEPLGLAWWAVDGQTLQITSRDAVGRIECVEFYAIPKAQLAAGAAFADSLKKAIAERPNKAVASDEMRMQVDEPSGRLIVRASPEVHRFLNEHLNLAQKP